MHRNPLDRAHTRTTQTIRNLSSLAIAAFAACFVIAAPVSASLIMDSVRYDGNVRSGATTGIEKHSTTVDLPPNPGSIPADNTMLPPPLQAGNNLSTTLTETNDNFNGQPVRHSILTISAPSAVNIFKNTLDSNIPLPVEFDAVFYSNMLNAGEKVAMQGIGIENFGLPPWPAPGSQVITGTGDLSKPLGSSLNPMRVQLGISANQVDDFRYGFVKVHLYYMTMPMTVPEPTTWALMLLGIVGVAGVAHRRHR